MHKLNIIKSALVLTFVLFSAVLTPRCNAEPFFLDGVPIIPRKTTPVEPTLPRFNDLARELSDAVVNISVESSRAEDEPQVGEPDAEPLRSLGSGFVVNQDGYIITSNHVIENAEKIVVRFTEERHDYRAEVIGRDPQTDIALLKIDHHGPLKSVYLGDSDKLEVGDWVMAIGNQFQLGLSVTAGIVSAKSRRIPGGSSRPYDAFIQTDAPINPGSSGGPLFNASGQVVGINTAIFSPGRSQFGNMGFNVGIGFAIPINLARSVVMQLKERGKVTRGLLGVLIQRVDEDVAELLGLGSPSGALVSDVLKESPAMKAGFKRRDVIISFNGNPVKDHDELPLMVASMPVGSKVAVEVIRDHKKISLDVVVAEMNSDVLGAKPKATPEKPDEIGLSVDGVTDEIAKLLSMPEKRGVVVTAILPGSAADRAGLVRGDIIEEFANSAIDGIDAYKKSLADSIKAAEVKKKTPDSLEEGEPVLLLVRRKEGTRYVILHLKSKPVAKE